MKKVKGISLLLLLLILISGTKMPGGTKSSSLEIKGYVFKNENKVDKAMVTLYQNNKVVQKAYTKKSKFEFILFSGLRYMVEISLDGCVTERIQISTLEKTEFSGKYLYEFRVDMKDMDQFKGVDISDLDFPTALIQYNPDEGEYWHDEAYSNQVKKELKQLKAKAKKN